MKLNCDFKMQTSASLIVLIVFVVGLVAGACDKKPTSIEFQHLLRPSKDSNKSSGKCYLPNQIGCSKNCKGVFICILDEGEWNQIEIEQCTAGQYCNELTHTCTSGLSTCSPTNPPVYQLQCYAGGRFPDPFDCTVYHQCGSIGALSTVAACEDGWSYNALTTNCDHRLSDGDFQCFPAGRIPKCTSPGQSGPFPENPNIYYICLQTVTGLLPELFKCEHGGYFSNGECISMADVE